MILYRGRKLLLSYEAMPCPLCGHDQTYKHGKTSKGKLVSIHFYKTKFINFLWDGHLARPGSAT
jgi:hypothetical protein